MWTSWLLENTYGICYAQVGFVPSEVYDKYVSSLATSAYTSEDNLGNYGLWFIFFLVLEICPIPECLIVVKRMKRQEKNMLNILKVENKLVGTIE